MYWKLSCLRCLRQRYLFLLPYLGGIVDGVCTQLWEIEKRADEGIGYGFGARLVLGMETENSLPTHREERPFRGLSRSLSREHAPWGVWG
jgi:hypothetical protein